MSDPREELMAAPKVPYNGPKEIVIRDWLPNITSRLFILMEKSGASNLAKRWFQFTEWRARQLEEFLMKREDKESLLHMSEPQPENDAPANPASPVTPTGHPSAASSSSSSASGQQQQAANLLGSNTPAQVPANQQQQQQQPTPPPTTTPMVKPQQPTSVMVKQQQPTPTTTPTVKQQQPTPTSQPKALGNQHLLPTPTSQPLDAEMVHESRERYEARMMLLLQVSSKSTGTPKGPGLSGPMPTNFHPQARPNNANPQAITALLQTQTARPKSALVPPWKTNDYGNQPALSPRNSSSSSSRPPVVAMPISAPPAQNNPGPSQAPHQAPRVRPAKFIPNPSNPAELRLRALKDKRNERENLRRMRKRATEEAAAAKAASNSE